MSEDTKNKIRIKAIGRLITEEVKEKISKKNKGENNFFYGRTHSQDVKEILSKKRKKKVYQYSDLGFLIRVWDSAIECENDGYSKNSIQKCCNQKQYIYNNCVWSYVELCTDDVLKKFNQKQLQDLNNKNEKSKRLKGKRISEEQIEIIRKTHKGKTVSQETRDKISKKNKGKTTDYNINRRLKIYQYDTDFNLVKIWDSTCDIGNAGYSRCNISKECHRSLEMKQLPRLRHNYYWSFIPLNKNEYD